MNISYEDFFIPVEKNIRINAWYVAPRERDITVLFCHGNGGNLSSYAAIIKLLKENGYGVLAIDYRGYGKSTGKPSEKGLYNDVRSAIKYLKENKNTPEEKIVLWGFSLGGAITAQIASENDNFRGVILHSTFTNLMDMASQLINRACCNIRPYCINYTKYYTFIQKILPTRSEYKTDEKISGIKSRLLLAHAVPDHIIPFKMTLKLADLNPGAELFISQEGGHNEYDWFYPRLLQFLRSL